MLVADLGERERALLSGRPFHFWDPIRVSHCGGSWERCSFSPTLGALAPHQQRPIVLGYQEVQNISDSLRRAYAACDAAGQLCSRAACAFAEESNTIAQCKEVVDSYLQ